MNIDIKFYFFIDTLDEIIKKNIKNFKKLSFIYKSDSINDINHANIKTIKNFCKKNKIPFFISENFKIIGSAHNQLEYSLKNKQSCEMIMLSPLFYNKKYSQNKILNVCKFNLLSMGWHNKICALGGISLNNLKKLNMTRCSAAAFISLMKENNQKKSPLTISSKRAF